MIKYGIIGCGNIGSKRIEAIAKDKDSKLEFVIGPKSQKFNNDYLGKKVAKKHRCIYSEDINLLLKSDVKAIILSTGPTLFKKIGGQILNSGKHLLIEKPLGKNYSDAKYLTNLANKKKLVLKTGFNLRFDDAINEAKKYIKKKKIGKIYFMKCTYVNGSVLTNKNKVGALSDIGSHSLNLIDYFIGKKINNVKSFKISHEHAKDDNGFLNLRINKILCSIHYSFVRWKNSFSLEISGQKGYVSVKSLPKWGKQTLIIGKRVFPSGVPILSKKHFYKDNSWYNEWLYFKKLIKNCDLSQNNEGITNMKVVEKINKIND
tara:strand:- start:569 stop:1522 length:954 start_codon:yes stop_codon:yes gene_type:complete